MSNDRLLITKVTYRGVTKKFPLRNEETTYDEFLIMMQRIFKGAFNSTDPVTLLCLDEDDEWITISDTEDLAFIISSHENLRLMIVDQQVTLCDQNLLLSLSGEFKSLQKSVQNFVQKLDHIVINMDKKVDMNGQLNRKYVDSIAPQDNKPEASPKLDTQFTNQPPPIQNRPPVQTPQPQNSHPSNPPRYPNSPVQYTNPVPPQSFQPPSRPYYDQMHNQQRPPGPTPMSRPPNASQISSMDNPNIVRPQGYNYQQHTGHPEQNYPPQNMYPGAGSINRGPPPQQPGYQMRPDQYGHRVQNPNQNLSGGGYSFDGPQSSIPYHPPNPQ